MATLTVNCGSFRKSSVGGTTVYGTLQNFQIPANSGITGCTVTFTTHAATGTTADRSFSLNGSRAYSGWPSSGVSLNAGLLQAGNNSFRVTLRSTGGATESCFWDISNITLYITYNDGGGGSAPPVGGGGPVVITPSSIDAGAGSVTVTCPAEAGIWHMIDWSFGAESGSWSHPWEAGGTRTISIPLLWIAYMPNTTQGVLSIRVRRSTTPAMPYSYATDQTTNVTIKVPASVVPSISNFTATLVPNGAPGTIAGYVQNKSKVALAMTAAGGSYSPIASYEISGGGISGNAATGTFGPFNLSGDVVFTAKVTDGRGRTATRQVAIEIMPYTAPAFSSPEAWRSNFDGVKNQKGTYVHLKSGVSFSSLGEQNEVTLKGRVYIKGGVAPAWETMTPDTELILGGGALLFTRTYIAQIQVSDLLESRITEFIIPTKKTGFSILAGMLGAAIGKSAETPGIFDVLWPIYARGNPVCEFKVGGIYITTDATSPEDLWPGTEWQAIAAGTFLTAAGEGYEVNSTGGEATHVLTVDEMPVHDHSMNYGLNTSSPGTAVTVASGTPFYDSLSPIADTGGGEAHENRPPYLAVYMWQRTA